MVNTSLTSNIQSPFINTSTPLFGKKGTDRPEWMTSKDVFKTDDYVRILDWDKNYTRLTEITNRMINHPEEYEITHTSKHPGDVRITIQSKDEDRLGESMEIGCSKEGTSGFLGFGKPIVHFFSFMPLKPEFKDHSGNSIEAPRYLEWEDGLHNSQYYTFDKKYGALHGFQPFDKDTVLIAKGLKKWRNQQGVLANQYSDNLQQIFCNAIKQKGLEADVKNLLELDLTQV